MSHTTFFRDGWLTIHNGTIEPDELIIIRQLDADGSILQEIEIPYYVLLELVRQNPIVIKQWNSIEHTSEQALDLPKGSYAADFGFLVEQSVEPNHTLEAAEAIKKADKNVSTTTQAQLIVLAKKEGVAFKSWVELVLI